MKISRSSRMMAKKPTATQSPLVLVRLILSGGAACDGGGSARAGCSGTVPGCSASAAPGRTASSAGYTAPGRTGASGGGGTSSPGAWRASGAPCGVGCGSEDIRYPLGLSGPNVPSPGEVMHPVTRLLRLGPVDGG